MKDPRTGLIIAAFVSLACLTGSYLWVRSHKKTSSQTEVGRIEPLKMAGADAGYLDPASCARCHQGIWDTYRRTGMGRSFSRVRPETVSDHALGAAAFYHKPSDQYYTTYRKDGKLYQRRHQTGLDERETNVIEQEIDFVIGSGNHVRSFLHRTPEGRIFELPVGWYAESGGFWAMNPGYDRPDHDNFRRQISAQCMFCHNGYPEIREGADSTGTAPLFPGFIPDGIDCQRCHGPGRTHVEAVQTGKATRETIQKSIVNPARLSAERQMDLCMQCHLETTSFRLPQGIVRYSRGIFSYRPGEPLGDYSLSFDHTPNAGYDDKFEIASAAYRLRKSACFRESRGALQCTTCHNPHDIPRGQDAQRHYTAACRNCHSGAFQRLVAANRHTASESCAECHMPKRRTDDVVHAVMTDHFIQRKRPVRDLLAPLAEKHQSELTAYKGEVVLYYPQDPPDADRELYLAVAQVRHGANLELGVPRLEKLIGKYRPARGEFYFELAEAFQKSGQGDKAIAMYQEALRRSPKFRPALQSLGSALAKSGRLQEAAGHIQQALRTSPEDPALLNDLALVYISQGKGREAVELLQRALRSLPDMADAYNNLGGALTMTGDRPGAEEAYRNAIRVQPDLAGAHKNLAGLLAGRELLAEAEYHYAKAILSDPAFVAARFEFGIVLAQTGRYRDAAKQFEATVRLDPAHAEAHNSLGDMESLLGNNAKAIQHYKQAVVVRPDFPAAYLGLGTTLAAAGKRAEAIPNLEKAAHSADPAVQQSAQEGLRALQR
jgi:tetratricopeptide (TPR) repeat protein